MDGANGAKRKDLRVIGKPHRKVDAASKVTGQTKYADDLVFPRMLYTKILRSTVPHGRILKIDQPKISRLLQGRLSGFSTERLMHFLTLLGRDVEIVVKRAPRSRRQGRVRVVART